MPYSTKVSRLQELLPMLGDLTEGRSQRWEVPEGQAQLLAYRIREALYIAALNAEAFPVLAKAAAQFKIQVISPTIVQATPKQAFQTEAVKLVEAGGGENATVVQGLEPAGKPHELVAPSSATEVVGFWTEAQPSNSKFTFPQHQLDLSELTKLYHWTLARGWLMFVTPDNLTLVKTTKSLEDSSWHPSDGVPT